MSKAFKWTALATAVAVTLGSTVAVAAEGGVPEALAKVNATLNSLIATVNSLQASVTQLASTVTPPAAPTSATLITGPVAAVGNNDLTAGCNITNVGTTPATVTYALVSDGGSLDGGHNVVLAPGASTATISTFGFPKNIRYCKFVANVPPSQLRAMLVVYDAASRTVAVAEAR